MKEQRFWQALEQLVATSKVTVDRPRNSAHPRYPDFTYPTDYGYLEGTQSADGGGIDVWIGSLVGREVTGVVFTLDHEKRDLEGKILLGCTVDEAAAIAEAHNQGRQAAILILRTSLPP